MIPPRATHWTLRTRSLELGRRPRVMGIVNVTPDSFSDGGRFLAADRAIAHAQRLVAEGADLLDIGGESTRPYSEPVPEDEELRRVLPVVQEVCRTLDVPVSVDTTKAGVAEACLAAGAEIVNDIRGLAHDPDMLNVVIRHQAAVCVMHMQGTPQTMQDDPTYDDVVSEVADYLAQRRDWLVAAGLDLTKICLDPGIGFGKTHAHNLALLRHCARFHDLQCPVLIGHSRKGFIAHVLGDRDADRTAGSVGVACAVARRGAHIVRVHDVAAVRDALLLMEAAGGLDD